MIFPIANFYFLESRPAPVLGNISFNGIMRANDRPWAALSLVLCAHLAVFAALRPQPQSLSFDPMPEPIMVSLLSAPQTAVQKPMPPAKPIEKAQKPVKKPINKPVAPVIKQASLPVAPPVEQTSMPTAAVAAQETQATNSKPVLSAAKEPADTQPYRSPSFNAAYLNNPAPNYPSVSRRLGEQGLVLLLVQVTADGTAGSVELQTGSGSSRLDQAALEAVKKWRFIPAKRGEQPVSASVTVPVRFSIEG
ncbi:MAG: energy transducer TonB [Methylobacter sp.]